MKMIELFNMSCSSDLVEILDRWEVLIVIYFLIRDWDRMVEQTTEMDRILLGNTRDLKEVRVSENIMQVEFTESNIRKAGNSKS